MESLELQIKGVRTLPGRFVGLRAEGGDVLRAAGKREHGHGLTDPDALIFEVALPEGNLEGIVFGGLDQVGLNPGDALACINKELADAIGGDAAVLIHGIAAGVGDGLDAALEGDAVGASEQVERLFIPEIDSGLKTERDGAVGELFKQCTDLLADAEDLVDEVDVVDAASDELIDLGKDLSEVALAVFVTEEGLVAEGAGVGATAGELNLSAVMKVIGAVAGEDVVEVMVALDRKVGVVEGAERAHIGGAETRGHVDDAAGVAPTATGNHLPGMGGELGQSLIGLAAQNDVGAGLLQGSFGRDRAMRTGDDGL